jgi:adenylylsulfate kinase-like enzyme
MIIVFYGQPHSGKTTLATKLQETLFLQHEPTPPIIDGDEIRNIFKNKDYSKEGRIKNLNRISDIATYLESKYKVVIISAVYPIKEAREYLDSISENVVWVYLKYNDIRGREEFHVKDFDVPSGVNNRNLFLNTSIFSIDECIKEVISSISL